MGVMVLVAQWVVVTIGEVVGAVDVVIIVVLVLLLLSLGVVY